MNSEVQPEFLIFFTEKWVVIVRSQPSFGMFRATPEEYDRWLPLVTNPAKNELQDTKDKIWDKIAIDDRKQNPASQYCESNTRFNI